MRPIGESAHACARFASRPGCQLKTSLGHSATLPSGSTRFEGGRSALLLADAIRIAKICQAPLENLAHPQATPSTFRQPITMEDWRAMYRQDEARANAHFSLDRLFNNTAAVASGE